MHAWAATILVDEFNANQFQRDAMVCYKCGQSQQNDASVRTRPNVMRLLIAIVIAAALSASTARADQIQTCEGRDYIVNDGFSLVCSATWAFTGSCVGRDMWADWKVHGRTTSTDSFVRPWLDVPIRIVGYEMVKIAGSTWWPRQMYLNNTRAWFMVGSTIQPDGMIWLAPGETHAKQMWPAGHGQIWPSKDKTVPTNPVKDTSGKAIAFSGELLDLHGQCYGGIDMQILVTIYYSPLPSSVTPDSKATR